MKKLSTISILLLILLVTLGCNLSTFLSDTPPVDIQTPTEAVNSGDTIAEGANSCISPSDLSDEFAPIDVNLGNESDQLNQLTNFIKNIFQEAKISQYATFTNSDKTKIISCIKLEPIGTVEKATFDLVLNNPDSFIGLIDLPELKIETSSLTDDFSNIGDNSHLFHISFGNENSKNAELLASRNGNSVVIYSYLYANDSNDLEDFRAVLATLQ